MDTLFEAVADCPLPRPLVVNTIRGIGGYPQSQTSPSRRHHGDHPATLGRSSTLSRLQPAVNGTGVVVHTNLGRAPIAPPTNTGYTNLEIDLTTGRRGKRAAYVEQCLAELCGAEAAMVK